MTDQISTIIGIIGYSLMFAFLIWSIILACQTLRDNKKALAESRALQETLQAMEAELKADLRCQTEEQENPT